MGVAVSKGFFSVMGMGYLPLEITFSDNWDHNLFQSHSAFLQIDLISAKKELEDERNRGDTRMRELEDKIGPFGFDDINAMVVKRSMLPECT